MLFRLSEQHYPVGLLEKDAYVFLASGSFLADSPMDHQLPYLNTFLGFIGMDVKATIIAGGQAMGEPGEAAFSDAKVKIAELAI